ncbi:MAG: substrate-binding domain-containing protein [Lachnospiraceae bacterium]|nr:substrate-binding domain-containing protein [Lachnospiraceae bacterium]
MRKLNSGITNPVAIGMVIIVAVTLSAYVAYHSILDRVGVNREENVTTYDQHFALITDDTYASYWNEVYDYAQEEANANGAYVELLTWTPESTYTMCDLMDKSMACGVDGIILVANTEAGLEEKINEATNRGIPVVTLMEDVPQSQRISYIGINPVSLGTEYAKTLIDLVPDDEEEYNIKVLLTDDRVDANQYQIFTQINTDVVNHEKTKKRVSCAANRVATEGFFLADEDIQELFRNQEEVPEYVVCFSTATTEIAYQAIVDYNLVGKVQVVGYALSPMIEEALENDVVATTLVMDTQEMGTESVDALLEYETTGYTNAYYGVDLEFMTKEGVAHE